VILAVAAASTLWVLAGMRPAMSWTECLRFIGIVDQTRFSLIAAVMVVLIAAFLLWRLWIRR